MRGIRGAISIHEDSKDAIYWAAAAMVEEVMRQNGLAPEDIGAAIFSMTEDLTSAFPSSGVREQVEGFEAVPLFDTRQLAIEGGLPRCIRVLLLADTDTPQKEIKHVYLGAARKLRPDIAKGEGKDTAGDEATAEEAKGDDAP